MENDKRDMGREKQTRLELRDTRMEILQKMSGDNPGALRVCMEILQEGGKIDPDAALGGLATFLTLDTLQIYEDRIWMLYKDVCGEDLMKMIAALRAWQLGFLTRDILDHAIDNCGDGIAMDDLEQQVKEFLPNFGKDNKEEDK